MALEGSGLSLIADFADMAPRLRQSNLEREVIVKAARIKSKPMPQTVLDATAGLGEDSLILAAAGFQVHMYEYDSIIAALLEDAMIRAGQDESLAPVVKRMSLTNGDSIMAMKNLDYVPDVVLLDPMFPKRQKTGKIKKKFQILQQLERPCGNEADLLEAALGTGAKKVIIKRPQKGPYLADRKPDYSLDGKAIRYDVIIL
ncbi:MAG: class I SAM-dependent methyltransferase [Pseudobutyrivibrio sp.]|nr:class I SAM-dependent methyltransferase [Pseudobutyrivibrio sp.]